MTAAHFGQPLPEQVAYLRQKLNLPSQRWDDIQRQAHDRAFIVAGAMAADLVADLHAAVVAAAENGKGIAAFRREFGQIVARHGWTGWTGEGTRAGRAWRTRTIYQTNMATSHAAAQRQAMLEPEYLRLRPFWQYVHSGSADPRPEHKAWDGLTLPAVHPFWRTHFPPNGWGCRCRVRAVSEQQAHAAAQAGLDTPPAGWDTPTPNARDALPGITAGFDWAAGSGVAATWSQLIDDKLLKLNAPIGAMLWAHLKPLLAREHLAAWQAAVDRTAQTMRATGEVLRVTTISPEHVAALRRAGVELENAAVWVRDAELLHALRDTKAERGAAIASEIWRDLPLHLENARAWLDTHDEALIYALELGERWGKVVVRVNYNASGRFDGKRARIKSNFVSTGGWVKSKNLLEGSQYKPLQSETQ